MKLNKYLINLITLLSFTAQAQTAVIPNNTVSIGKTGVANKTIEFNLTKAGASANPKFRYNSVTGTIQKADDGVNFVDIGASADGGILTNGGFETSTTDWTASGGTLSTSTTAADIFSGKVGGTWDSSSAAQTLTYAPKAINGLAGTNGEATCFIRVPSGTATHTMGIWDGTTLSSTKTIANPSGATTYFPTTINFIFGASGTSAGIRFTSVNANEPLIDIDKCYLGAPTNLQSVSQSVILGENTITGCNATYQRSNTSFGDFTNSPTGCTSVTSGQATWSSGPTITVPNYGAGVYEIEGEGGFGRTNTTDGNGCFFRFSDGTNASKSENFMTFGSNSTTLNLPKISGSIVYTTPPSGSTITFKVQMKSDVNTNPTCQVLNLTGYPGTFRVRYTPSTAQQAVSAAQQRAPTVQRFTSGSGTYTTPSGVTYIKVTVVGGGGGGTYTGSGTAGTASTFGSSLLTANGGAGGAAGGSGVNGVSGGTVTINAPAVTIVAATGGGSGGSIGAGDGSGVGGNSIFGGGGASGQTGSAGAANTGGGGGGGGNPASAWGGTGGGAGGGIIALISNPTSTYPYAVGGGGAAGSGGGAGGSGVIVVEEYYSQSAPLLIGSVTSNTTGSIRDESAILVCSASSSITNQFAAGWITSIGNVSGGNCVLTLPAGTFSSAPVCTISSNDIPPAGEQDVYTASATSATSVTITQRWQSTGNTTINNGTSYSAVVNCRGPR